MRIACWSGPRNLSTAMMYCFGQRADCTVVDEPFYAAYLAQTGLAHPMRDAVLASQSQDGAEVARMLAGDVPGGRALWYQKHMCQHMIPGIPRGFMAECVNVFLLRHPARVVASFTKAYDRTTAADIGFALQVDLFDHVRSVGQTPVVIDSADIRENPEHALRALCDAIGLNWDPAMLHWPKGPKDCDGVWAAHWYASVHDSTGFAGPEGPLPKLEGHARQLADEAMEPYTTMAAHKLSL